MTVPIERHCPKCHALVGMPCLGARGHARKAFHRERGSRWGLAPKFEYHGLTTESPIEDKLVGAITAWLRHHDIMDTTLETQVVCGPYRFDMVVTSARRKLVVECDGKQFHSSYAAVQRDKARDRFCVTQGMAVMRFTGQEIHKNARDCASQVGLWIRAQR